MPSRSKKRIVIDVRESGTSTGRYVDKFIEHLHSLSPDLEIMMLAKSHRLTYLRTIAPEFQVIETPFEYFTFGEQLGFKDQIKNLKPDLVHFTMVQQPIFYRGTVVTTMHDLTRIRFNNPAMNPLVFAIKHAIYTQVNKRVAKKSQAIITPSQFVKDDIVAYTNINPDKITVTHEAADRIADEPKPLQRLDGKEFIMYVGTPHVHKNLENLILAHSKILQTHPDLILALMGKQDENYKRIEHFAREHEVKNIVFTGFVSESELRWSYEHCRAYIFPSLSEGFGLPSLEAMIHGAPVVCSNSTCLPEINGSAARFFNPLDINDMADKITEVIDNEDTRRFLIERGYKQVTKYSWDKMAEQTLAIYHKLLQENDSA